MGGWSSRPLHHEVARSHTTLQHLQVIGSSGGPHGHHSRGIGIPLRADEGVDSYSMLALMKGEGPSARKHAVSCSIRGIPSIRDGKWKLILDAGSGGWSKGDSNHPVQLYNLENDLGEQHNLAPLFPDRVDHMSAMWEEVIDRGRSTPGVEQANDVEVDRHLR